ncbi:hypothetical protein L0P88_15670 [Muricauda sp. SCSIO 64092]|uniref:hypothetical protein n=1 Tax=Allomuricauda sp. SCSIO 64092 TaxID=2908842 RepID=UPI001FF34D7C|nr:hypothetical protein [Muricauda sp. SCSIO 64092]UOY05384.1 hypothetical protein L0P88_15670 [Muricauda sp. SCSIO 64092]
MIFVQRPECPTDLEAVLTAKNEYGKALNYYAQVPLPKKAFDFGNYRQPKVKLALNRLFHKKCAYCETFYAAAGALNVEHYRPKGGVKDAPDPDTPRYWWLAAKWDNLLPSCISCNQKRKQHAIPHGASIEQIKEIIFNTIPKESMGKSNYFPTKDQVYLDSEDDTGKVEEPLLIDPCRVDPENHLEWYFDRDHDEPIWLCTTIVPFLRPKQSDQGQDEKGEKSIQIYGLNRGDLVYTRLIVLKQIQTICAAFVDALYSLNVDVSDAQKEIARKGLKRNRLQLEGYMLPESQYSGMAKAFYALFKKELNASAAM